MNREVFEGLLWRLSQVAEDVRSNAPIDLTEDEKIELLAIAGRLGNLVFHRPAVTEREHSTSEQSVRAA